MKIRIKSNSVRFRLTKSEVQKLSESGYVEERTDFPGSRFVYALQRTDAANELSATFGENKITMFVPASFVNTWPANAVVGIDATVPVAVNDTLYLLLEKDFVCLDDTTEDQSDNYENPNTTC